MTLKVQRGRATRTNGPSPDSPARGRSYDQAVQKRVSHVGCWVIKASSNQQPPEKHPLPAPINHEFPVRNSKATLYSQWDRETGREAEARRRQLTRPPRVLNFVIATLGAITVRNQRRVQPGSSS